MGHTHAGVVSLHAAALEALFEGLVYLRVVANAEGHAVGGGDDASVRQFIANTYETEPWLTPGPGDGRSANQGAVGAIQFGTCQFGLACKYSDILRNSPASARFFEVIEDFFTD